MVKLTYFISIKLFLLYLLGKKHSDAYSQNINQHLPEFRLVHYQTQRNNKVGTDQPPRTVDVSKNILNSFER